MGTAVERFPYYLDSYKRLGVEIDWGLKNEPLLSDKNYFVLKYVFTVWSYTFVKWTYKTSLKNGRADSELRASECKPFFSKRCLKFLIESVFMSQLKMMGFTFNPFQIMYVNFSYGFS